MDDFDHQARPLVSVLVPTFNRRRYLAEALGSIARQTYAEFEAFVVNDGGEPVADVVESLGDPRFHLIDRRENRGKAHSLNEALARAQGKYVAYLDDDDRWYPNHLATLVEALEGPTDCQAAYTDLYKVHCRVLEDGTRQVLGKVVNISRDFDRFFLCYFNHVLHVSLMHRRDLLEKTGLYNENLRVLIDWDMTRRLAFFTDFLPVHRITGEFYGPVGRSDRISYRMRLDKTEYLRNVLMIRATRPPKPWPRMPDLSLLFLPQAANASAGRQLRGIWQWTFMPYEIYLPLPAAELAQVRTDMTNFVPVRVPDGATMPARLDVALARCQGDYVAVVPEGVEPACLWLEDPMYAAYRATDDTTAFAVPGSDPRRAAVVMRRSALRRVRRRRESLSLSDSLAAAGITVREPAPAERTMQFDRILQETKGLEEDGNWVQAATIYGKIPEHCGNGRWMRELAALALCRAADRDDDTLALCRDLNRTSPTVSTLLLEAKLHRRRGDLEEAVCLLTTAETVLKGEAEPCN